jgi:hypothetical protein
MSELADRLIQILGNLANGFKTDPSWMRPMPLTRKERGALFLEGIELVRTLQQGEKDNG